MTQTEVNAMIGRYVVENLLPLTVDSDSFKAKYQGEQVPVGHAEIHFLNTYVDAEYAKMTAELKKGEEIEFKKETQWLLFLITNYVLELFHY